MLYQWFELGHAAVKPARAAADAGKLFFNNPFNPLTHTSVGRHAAAACEVFERTTRRYEKPTFGIHTTDVDGQTVSVLEEVVWQRPFCRVLHFKRDIDAARGGTDPRILLVAPMSGHFATLLRGTVEALLPDHEVYITDWMDARNVPVAAGGFDLDDYIVYMQDMFRHFRGDVHVFAVCQPSVPVLAAVALMEQEGDPHVPISMVLAGGPIDTRIAPTEVNKLAQNKGTDWFRSNVITTVPWPSQGFGRPVYPGFLQLTGFMTMNLDRHMKAHKDLFYHLVQGDGDSAEKHRDFYDEYLAVMDLTSEFYIQTIDQVFVRHLFAKGEMYHRNQRIDLTAIRRVALMTVEGEKDDITASGNVQSHSICVRVSRLKINSIMSAQVSATTASSTARASVRILLRELQVSCAIMIRAQTLPSRRSCRISALRVYCARPMAGRLTTTPRLLSRPNRGPRCAPTLPRESKRSRQCHCAHPSIVTRLITPLSRGRDCGRRLETCS